MASESGDGRLDELERRIRRIERRLGIERLPLRRDAAPDAIVGPESMPTEMLVIPPAAPEPQAAIGGEPEPIIGPPVEPGPPPLGVPAPPTTPEVVRPNPRLDERRPRAAGVRAPAFDLERTIGAKWFAAAGAVVVVIGVGLFLKLAIDRGWMNLIPPAWKCVSGAAFGAVLLGVGEVIRRRLGALASAGVSAAGLGALFASVYAAYGVYHLVPAGLAFVLLGVVAVVGFGVAALGRLVSIAVLSLVAAYVNPIIIGDTGAAPLVLPAYLFALLCLGLALSAWRAQPFRLLRGLVWWGTLIFGTLWILDQGGAHPAAALTFLAGCWAVLHTELALSAARGRSAPEPGVLELPWPAVRFVATSFSTTAWAVGLAVHVLRRGTPVGDWLAPAITASITATLAVGLAGRLRVLRDVPRTDLERLGAGLAMQAGALVMAAIALGLSGWTEAVAWLSLGVAAMGAGRWIRSRGLDVYGVVALIVATGRLLFVDSPPVTPPVEIATLAGLVITRWTLLMVAGAAAWAGASVLLRRQATWEAGGPMHDPWKGAGRGALIVAMCHLNASLLNPGADQSSIAVAWLVLGLAGLALGRRLVSPGLGVYGVIVLALSTLRVAADAPVFELGSGAGNEFAGIIFGRWMYLMLGAAGAWALAAWAAPVWSGSDEARRWRPLGSGALVLALTLVSLSLVHPLADAGSVCTVWLALGLGGLLIGRGLRSFGLVGYGVVMLGAASARFLWGAPISGTPGPILAEGLGLVVTRWTLLMLGGATAWLIGAALVRDEDLAKQPVPIPSNQRTPLVAIGLAMIYAAALDPRAQAGSIALVWLAISAASVLSHAMFRRVALDVAGLIGMVLAVGAWTVEYPFGWMRSGARLGLHPGLLSSALIAGAAIAAGAWLRMIAPKAPPTVLPVLRVILPGALVLLFVSTSLEMARIAGTLASDPTARKAAVSIWWGVAAVGLIVAGFIRRTPVARHTGLALLAIATVKAAAFDLRDVPQLWRVVSFVGLGLLMLGVAVGYARASSLLREPGERAA